MSKYESFIDWEYSIPDLKKVNNKKNKFKSNNIKTNFYIIVLFFSIFGFLFFLTISVSSAATIETVDRTDDIFVSLDSKEYFEDFIFSDKKDKEIDNNLNIKYIPKKIEYQRYRVRSNDNIKSIAKKFGLLEDTIILCNNIKSERHIRPGDIIEIPNQDGRIIKVDRNDSLIKIANRYGVRVEDIVDVNDISSSNIIIGSKIFIPGSRMTQYEKNKFYEVIYIWPLKGNISSYFGPRIDPITGGYGYHTGIDIKGRFGYPVRATSDGVISNIGFNQVYGNYIEIKHKDGIVSIYAHLSATLVKEGEEINQGKIIGRVGNSGRSTGPHLHFEIRKNGKFIDPLKILM